ncbi:hypothetical protein Tfer_0854 [Thermincola ferriacetica]|uniref:Uncharacterized protein n=1 Tax=Thermincola ferriacetica TaxID=281456 RepID=A0A0L6W5C1_9FIRM|nr:hypothetical protein [Thermincola ferriacetica]KNZ70294.1 hypothetical protein Tfer_0854 [Thermincola ferriacetica]
MGFYRDIVRTARKEHKCDVCHGIIKAGEKYHDKAGNEGCEGNVWYSKECEACQIVINEFMKSDYADEGYCDEYIEEWWRDEKCPTCKHYFLPCKPDEWCKEHFHIGIESALECPERTKYGTCEAGDTCDEMTHYCRCERYEKVD